MLTNPEHELGHPRAWETFILLPRPRPERLPSSRVPLKCPHLDAPGEWSEPSRWDGACSHCGGGAGGTC